MTSPNFLQVTSFDPLLVGGGGAVASVAGKTGAVSLVKADVGLDQVDNTSDAAKQAANDSRYIQARSVLHNDPTGKADQNPLPIGYSLDTGHIIAANSGTSQAQQIGGVWTHVNAGSVGAASASYPMVDLGVGNRVRYIGGEIACPAASGASVCLISGTAPWNYNTTPATQPMVGVHVSIGGQGVWSIGFFNGNDAAGKVTVNNHLIVDTATALTLSVTTTAGPAPGTQVTSSITNLTAAGITTALAALSNVTAGNVTVTQNIDGTFSIQWAAALGTVTLSISASTGASTSTRVLAYPAGLTKYANGTISDFRDGKYRTASIIIEPEINKATVTLPDGSVVPVVHPAIGAYTGRYAIWELFESNLSAVDAPMSFRQIWADTRAKTLDSPVIQRSDLLAGLNNLKRVSYEYTTAGTYNNQPIPGGAVGARAFLVGTGGAGGGGSRQIAGTASCGGGAGSTGSLVERMIPAAWLTGGVFNVVIPAAPAGGAGATVDGNAGSNGTAQLSATTLAFAPTVGPSIVLKASPGAAATGGSTTQGIGGNAIGPLGSNGGSSGANGAAGVTLPAFGGPYDGGTSAANGGSNAYNGGPGQSGGGGGVTTANAATAGAAGTPAFLWGGTGGAGGVVGGAAPTSGAVAQTNRAGDGAGGGAGNAAGVAQDGAPGVGYGAGGGGGGGAHGGNGGNGGNGAPGYVYVEFYVV